MSIQIEAINIGKWSVGFAEIQNMTILSFEFKDRAPINLALSADQAAQIAAAIQAQLKSPPGLNR